MLRVNRVKVVIKTENGNYGINKSFNENLNFIISRENTSGKSSILEAIYYGLGLEEIIGGKGEKVLTPVYKTSIKDGENEWIVQESDIYLEISNGTEDITIRRSAKSNHRNTRLVTIYFSKLDLLDLNTSKKKDTYLYSDSATGTYGFHTFLEKFLNLNLPFVPTYDGHDRKLYLQLIFAGLFIEQKQGWSDIFIKMPNMGIINPKKRVIEYILKMDTLSTEKEKENLKQKKIELGKEWKSICEDTIKEATKELCIIEGVPDYLRILNENELEKIKIYASIEKLPLDIYISKLNESIDNLNERKPKIIDNFEKIQKELLETESLTEKLNNDLKETKQEIQLEQNKIKKIQESLEIIKTDLRNNKDAKKIIELGSDFKLFNDKCPTCDQKIQDSLLPQNEIKIMSIDENITHLEAQEKMFKFALLNSEQRLFQLGTDENILKSEILKFQKLSKVLRNDLYGIDGEISETIVYRKIKLKEQIENLNLLKDNIEKLKNELLNMSKKYSDILNKENLLPVDKLTVKDLEKIKYLKNQFVLNLKNYGFSSIMNFEDVGISEETFLPTIKNFDMKFDSSASDNIRGIWAFSMSLLQTSLKYGGNHPQILIFDEPEQQNVIQKDLESFFNSIKNLKNSCQAIIAITLDNPTEQAIIKSIEGKVEFIESKSFKKLP